MERVELEVFGRPAVNRMLMRPADNSRDFRPSWNVILNELERAVQRQFDSEGGEFGTPWDDLADSTVAKRGSAHPILDVDGDLRASFLPGHEGHVRNVTGSSAEWGSDLETPTGGWTLGRIHQEGAPRAGIPARPILHLDETRRRRIVDVLMEGLFQDAHGFVRAPSGQFAALGL
jgi:phage gpG-like protein